MPQPFGHRLTQLQQTLREMPQLAWRAQPACFVGLLLMELAQGIMPLGTAWLTKLLFDLLAQALQGKTPPAISQSLILILAGQAALIIFDKMAGVAGGFLNAELERQISLTIQTQVYQKINSLHGLAPFEDPTFHDAIQMAAQNAQMGPQQALSVFTNLLRSTFTLTGFLFILISFNPLLAGLVCITALPQLYAQLKLGKQHFGIIFENTPRQRRAFYYSNILSSLSFAKELRLLELGDYFIGAFRDLYQEIHASQRQQQLREMRWQFVLTTFFSLATSGAFVFVIFQALAGRLSLGDITLYTSAVTSVQAVLGSLIFAISNLNESALFFTSFTDLLARPDPLSSNNAARLVPPLETAIEFRDVSFRYSDQLPWVLRNIHLTIPAGQCTALVGLNGQGKTTLIKLLMRFYDPLEGQILWDGVDLREFDVISLRCRIGAIFQDFAHYDLTARENIGFGNVQQMGDPDRIALAATQAGVDETIKALPQGYQTVLSRWLADAGEGTELSGGEWQRIALARMFMRDADVLVLDEPSAALDAQAEHDIYQSLVELARGRTSLLISHRLNTVRMANQVAVIENGHISEYGSHDELFLRGGTYANLYNMQAERYR